MDREQKKVAFQDNISLEELITKEHNLDEQIVNIYNHLKLDVSQT